MEIVAQKNQDRSKWVLAICMLGAVFLFSSIGYAEDTQSAQTSNPNTDKLPSYFDRFIELPHEYLSSKFVDFASNVDSFFGSDRNFLESNKSVLSFDLTDISSSQTGNMIVPSFRAKLHLPGTQDRLHRWQERIHLLLETNPDKNPQGAGSAGIVQQNKTSLFKEVTTPDSYGAALRFENREDSPWRLSTDTGLKLLGASDVLKLNHTALDPFLRGRASYLHPLGGTQLKLTESVFWFNTIGAGETTQLDIDYQYSDPILWRSSSTATWLHDKQAFDLRQDFSCFQTLNSDSSLLYQASVIGSATPQTDVSEYVALILHRRRIHKDWVFVDLSPQLHYPKIYNYQLDAQLVLRMDILFSK